MEKCCADLTNRYVAETRKDIIVEKCKVCERRHITVDVSPVSFDVKVFGI